MTHLWGMYQGGPPSYWEFLTPSEFSRLIMVSRSEKEGVSRSRIGRVLLQKLMATRPLERYLAPPYDEIITEHTVARVLALHRGERRCGSILGADGDGKQVICGAVLDFNPNMPDRLFRQHVGNAMNRCVTCGAWAADSMSTAEYIESRIRSYIARAGGVAISLDSARSVCVIKRMSQTKTGPSIVRAVRPGATFREYIQASCPRLQVQLNGMVGLS